MKKNNLILSAALAAVFSTSAVFAEAEVTGKIVHESGFYSNAGSTIGDFSNSALSAGTAAAGGGLSTLSTPAHDKRDAFKAETSAKIYVDGELNEVTDGATYHVELNLMTDGKGGTNYDSNESYTQRDALREAYVDSQVGDWSLRTGKQQVVWGTADGMKLLDMINPTDYSEMAQNQMEDSRIPVWMVNAETTNADGSEFQVIVSQPRENVFAGLNRNIETNVRTNNGVLDDTSLNSGTDTGHTFLMKGVDTITGAQNGFLNIVPDLGSVGTRYAMAFDGRSAIDMNSPTGVTMNNLNDGRFEGFTVDGFEAMKIFDAASAATGGSLQHSLNGATFGTTAAQNGILSSNTPDAGGTGFSGTDLTNAIASVAGIDATHYANIPAGLQKAIWGVADQLAGGTGNGAALAAMADGTARTAALDAVTGQQLLAYGFDPLYSTNLSNMTTAKDSAFDYMGSTTFRTFDAFVNAKSQYVYNMPSDSDVDLALRFKNTTASGVNYSLNTSYNYDKNPIIDLSWRGAAGQELTTHKVISYRNGSGVPQAASGPGDTTTLQIVDAAVATAPVALANHDTGYYTGSGLYGGAANSGAGRAATLQFSQEVKRVKQIGGSFDTAIETAELGPVVIRGEVLYTKDGYSPVMNKDKLAIGDLVGALQMVKADRFKFVLGADITAMTNMMISAQFIQDSNLDFVDNGNNYTTDYATMHLSNGFNKAIKDKNFYSLFFSKPFGASGEHRWNNITMLEEGVGGNGKWNRLDAEFSIDDDTQATVEYNKYWGNPNTQFGQLEKASNVQVGVKYSF